MSVTVVGAGLAGSECAWQLARRGHRVRLFEMRPKVGTAAHQTDRCAELVCSNSFRSDNPLNAVGLLKREMEVLDSLIIRCARAAAVPAGDALAMDRTIFADLVTEAIASRPEIELVRKEVQQVPPEGYVVISSSLDFSRMYAMSRYGKGEGEDYWNCPLTRQQYEEFVSDLLSGETVPVHDCEKGIYFEGCLPLEVMEARGSDT